MLKLYERARVKEAVNGKPSPIFDRGLVGSSIACIRNDRLEVVFLATGNGEAAQFCYLEIRMYGHHP